MSATLPPITDATLAPPDRLASRLGTPDRALPSLTPVLAPQSIAVVGASRTPGTLGHQVVHNLITSGFTGAVYPVNPKAKAICAVRAAHSIEAIGEPVDTAVIVVPREYVLDVAEQCGEAGVRGLVVISAGFKELGSEGASHERDLLAIVRRYGMRMIGPNCMGVINAAPSVSMNATFAPGLPAFGNAAFVSQSGALGVSVLDYANAHALGISQFVSVGNKADVSGNDLLLAWEDDPTVQVILMYVENFGDPRRFLRIASRISKSKPIIALKSGHSRAGARAASSHTGALAASDVAVDALLSQAGVLRAASIEELFDIATAFTARALPKSRRTAVLTNAGGPGILAADALETNRMQLAELSESTLKALRPLLPEEASLHNPLDMIASATPAGYRAAMRALLEDPNIDAVVPIFIPPLGVKDGDVAEAIVASAAECPEKPVLAVMMGREGHPQGRLTLQRAGIPAYTFPESAARAVAALAKHREWIERPAVLEETVEVDSVAAAAVIEKVRRDGRSRLDEAEALELIAAYGIPTAPARAARGVYAASMAAMEVGYPLVLKVMSPDCEHKSDVGGVQVGIASDAELRLGYDDLIRRVHARAPEARIDGVLVQRMVRGGRETIAGVVRDPSFGPLVMFGLGGVLVEAIGDVVFRVAPIDPPTASEMIRGIRGAKILAGVRGDAPADTDAIAKVLVRLGKLAEDFPEIAELDVNPLLAFERGVVAVDARVRLA